MTNSYCVRQLVMSRYHIPRDPISFILVHLANIANLDKEEDTCLGLLPGWCGLNKLTRPHCLFTDWTIMDVWLNHMQMRFCGETVIPTYLKLWGNVCPQPPTLLSTTSLLYYSPLPCSHLLWLSCLSSPGFTFSFGESAGSSSHGQFSFF